MARFTTRVQLEGKPPESDYEALHVEMRKRGFIRFIQDRKGNWYQLPHAEYNRTDDAKIDDVLAEAKAAAQASVPNRKRKILVTASNGRRWEGLDSVTAAAVEKG